MLIGHKGARSITGSYIHGSDAVMLAAADRIAEAILRKLAGEGAAELAGELSAKGAVR